MKKWLTIAGWFFFTVFIVTSCFGGEKEQNQEIVQVAEEEKTEPVQEVKTPSPAPAPAPEPPKEEKKNTLTSQEFAYVSKLNSHLNDILNTNQHLSDVLIRADAFSEQWVADVYADLIILQVLVNKSKELESPSARFDEVHQNYRAAMNELQKFIDALSDGIADFDYGRLEMATAHMAKSGEYLTHSKVALEAIANEVQ